MKIIPNFLPDHFIDLVIRNNVASASAFQDSNSFWPEPLRKPGSHVLTRNLSKNKTEVLKKLMIVHGFMKEDFKGPFIAMAYNWRPLSYIPWHNDQGHEVGVTIYLNQTWNMDWGGLLLYRNEAGKIEVFSPTYNTAVINNSNIDHATTMLTPDAPPRLTIQCFWRTLTSE